MSTSTLKPENAIQSGIQEFATKIEREFIEGSAIDAGLFRATVDIVSDIETSRSGDVSTPIHDSLNWKYTRFGQQANATLYAAILRNENNSAWQAKLSRPRVDKEGQIFKYETPKGNGARAFLPAIPQHIRQRIAARYQVAVPADGSFWAWLEQHPEIPIVWTEGGKKALSLLSLGYPAIALLGVNGGYRSVDGVGNSVKPYLTPDVKRFSQPGRQHILAFDQDIKPSAQQRVQAALSRFGWLLEREKGQVLIASWDKTSKGIDDLLVNCGRSAVEEALKAALLFEQWQVQSYTRLSYEANLVLNHRYLGEFEVPRDAKLVCLKSPKGTGKTQSLKQLVNAAHAVGQRVLFISHRIQLCQALCDRVGLLSIYEVIGARGDKRKAAEMDVEANGFGLVVDSLHPGSQAQFQAEDWEDAMIVVDECEQTIWHLLNSNTCQSHRVAILRELKQLFLGALHPASKGRIVFSDADLSDLSINFAKGLAEQPELKPWVLVNEWKPSEPWHVTPYDSKEAWLLGIEERIGRGDRVMVVEDSQKPKSRYSTYSLEQRWRKQFPGKRILRIDSQTLEIQRKKSPNVL